MCFEDTIDFRLLDTNVLPRQGYVEYTTPFRCLGLVPFPQTLRCALTFTNSPPFPAIRTLCLMTMGRAPKPRSTVRTNHDRIISTILTGLAPTRKCEITRPECFFLGDVYFSPMAGYSKGFSDLGTVALMGSGANIIISSLASGLVVFTDGRRGNVYQFWLRIHL